MLSAVTSKAFHRQARQTIDRTANAPARVKEITCRRSRDGSLNPIEQETYDYYASLIHQRRIPFCDETVDGKERRRETCTSPRTS
jgi:hypothetical protein